MSTPNLYQQMYSAEPPGRIWPVGIRALRHRRYRLFFTGQLVSVLGTWMQQTAQAWLVYRLTGSVLLLGLVGFAGKIPIFILGMVGGLVADRFNRHRIVMATQTSAMIQSLLLGIMVVTGVASVWHIFVLAILLGVISAFDLPARQSFISWMVTRDDLSNALALNSSVFNAARVVGPAVAGVIVATAGEGVCFLINGISYMVLLWFLMRMRFDERHPGAASTNPGMLQGLGYARRTPPVRALLLLLGLVSLAGVPYVALMPVFAGEILGGGPRGLGVLMGASGVGAFFAAALLARRRSVRGLGRVVALGAIGFGASLVVFSASRSFWLSVVVLVVVGFSMITQAAATNLLLQSLCPDVLRGRVMSIYTVMLLGMAPWGSLLAGVSAHALGAAQTVLIGGIACAGAGVVFACRIPALRPHVRYAGLDPGTSSSATPRDGTRPTSG